MNVRRGPLLPVLIVLGLLVTAGSAAAATGLVLHGKGELVNPPLAGDLEIVSLQLEPVLVPGGSGDLILSVRNRSTLTVMADRVRLDSPLRDARPAGCTTKISGPLLQKNGVLLIGRERIALMPGRVGQLSVPSALSLAPSAKQGCGFRVQVDVQAVEAVPTSPPPTVAPSTTSPPQPTTPPPPTEAPPSEGGPTTITPPPLPDPDCDPADPDCVPE
jgi:hypothetical protein